ncbi:MAG: hypothetical protein IJJ10_06665 [Bacillus sp. (in: Bacteria)]|nr:hypothetical protein [Bacillus sp. (in: firmicutes)]
MKFIHDENHNRFEALDKQEFYNVLAEAIQQGTLPLDPENAAFITMIKSIVDGGTYKIGFCTEAEYHELWEADEIEEDAYYIITDDSSYDSLVEAIEDLQETIQTIENDIADLVTDVDQNSQEVNWLNNHARIKDDVYQYFSQTDQIYDSSLGYLPNVVLSLKTGKSVTDTIGISGCLKVTTSGNTDYYAYFDTHWNVADNKQANLTIIPSGSLLTVLNANLKLEHDATYGDILYLTENPTLKTFAAGTLTITTIALNGIKIYYK